MTEDTNATETEATESIVETSNTSKESGFNLGFNPLVWLEALFKRVIDGVSGRGGVEAFCSYLDNIDFIPELIMLRQEMKTNSIFFETALAKCNKEMLKRPEGIRQEEIFTLMGATCKKCGGHTTIWGMAMAGGVCKCEGEYVPTYVEALQTLLAQKINPSPEAVLMSIAYDKIAKAYVDAYEAIQLVMARTAEFFNWEQFRIEEPNLRSYLDQFFLGKMTGESKIPREEKETLQFIIRANLAGVDLETAKKIINLAINCVKYGYLYQVLGADGAYPFYDETLQVFNPLYDKINTYIRQVLSVGQETRRVHITVKATLGGYYAPCLLMPKNCWESGKIAGTIEMEPVTRFPIFPKADFGALQTIFAPIGGGKCVTYKTPIITSRGVELIGAVVEEALLRESIPVNDGIASFENTSGLSVPSLDKNTLKTSWETVTCFYKSYTKQLVKLKTASGRTFEPTPDHTFVVWDGSEIKVVNGASLKSGYSIPLTKKMPLPIKPSGYTKDWMKLFGKYAAEGNIQKNIEQKYPIISFEELAEAIEIKNIVENLGYAVSFRVKERKEHGNNDLRLSARLVPILEQFGEKADFKGKGSGACMKKIPQFMFLETEENISMFLDYYFKGDGWREHKRSAHTGQFSHYKKCISKSKELTDGINTLMLKIGEIPTIRAKTIKKGRYAGNTYWGCNCTLSKVATVYNHKWFERIYVHSLLTSLIKYAGITSYDLGRAISPTGNKRRLRVGEQKGAISIITLQKIVAYFETILVDYPFKLRLNYLEDRRELRRKLLEGTIPEASFRKESLYILKRRTDNHALLMMPKTVKGALLQRNAEKATLLLEILKSLITGDVYFDTIESAEIVTLEEPVAVYDITITPKHTFLLANGLFVHNTFLLSGIMSYSILNKQELIFSPLGDKSNSFTTACLPLFNYDERTKRLLHNLTEKLGVEPAGIPLLTLTVLQEGDKITDNDKNPPTIFDRVVMIKDPKSFEIDFKEVVNELKGIAETYGYAKTTGLITVRNLDRYYTGKNVNIDVQNAISLLQQFDAFRKSNLRQYSRVFIDEISYLASAQVTLYGSDALRSGATISDYIKESRRNKSSVDMATQLPLEVLPEIRNSATNVFFRDLAMSKDKNRSQIDFLLDSIRLKEPAIRPVIKAINERGLLPKGYWFWYRAETRDINVINPCPPIFCLQDPSKTPRQIFKLYEKATGQKILLDSWKNVPQITAYRSDMAAQKKGGFDQ